MNALPYDSERLRTLAHLLIDNIRELAQAGWTPATSSNFSHRLDDRHAAITVSGRDKGRLVEDDIMVVDFDGQAVGRPLRPSELSSKPSLSRFSPTSRKRSPTLPERSSATRKTAPSSCRGHELD